jgi:hypothetical protein
MSFLCISQQGEFKNTIKNLLEKIHVKKKYKKVKGGGRENSCHCFSA